VIERARSFKQGQVTRDEAHALIERFRLPHKVKHVRTQLPEIEHVTGDFLVVDGDLRIEGDLELRAEGAWVLVVLGDLIVGGAYSDSDDPESFLLVIGSMTARDVVTAGWLEVHGNLDVANHLIGDYNDCSAYVGGNVRARLLYPEEHHFEIAGEVHVEHALGIRSRVKAANAPAFIEMDDKRLLELFDSKLLRTFEDDEDDEGNPTVGIDGIEDFAEVKRRVRAGLPLR
jgi:hypothetical protein